MTIFQTVETKYQQLNSFYKGASLPVKMLFMVGIGVILSVIIPPIFKAGQEFEEHLHYFVERRFNG